MKILKTGIIGCGRIGSLLEEDPLRGKPCTHTGGFSALPNIKMVAGCDIDENRLKNFGCAGISVLVFLSHTLELIVTFKC